MTANSTKVMAKRSEVSADGKLGDHVQRLSDGQPPPPSYLYSLVRVVFESYMEN